MSRFFGLQEARGRGAVDAPQVFRVLPQVQKLLVFAGYFLLLAGELSPGPPCLQRAPSGEHPVCVPNWDGDRDLDLVVGISELSPFGRLFLSDGDGDGDGEEEPSSEY